MKYFKTVCFAVLFFISCKKESAEHVAAAGTGKIEITKGNNQSGLFGEVLNDTLVLKITSANPTDHFLVTFVQVHGNGQLEQVGSVVNYPLTRDTAGMIRVNWRMGCDAATQKLRFYVFTDSTGGFNSYHHTPSDSVDVTATAVKPSGWCRACGYGKVDAFEAKIVTADNNTLYLINNGLFSSTDGG